MNIYDFHIVNNHLCAVHQIVGEELAVSVVPLFTIFRNDSGKINTPTTQRPARSQDVFRHPFKVMIPNTSLPPTGAYFQHINFCTSSWRTPSLCELDATATPTRILLSFYIDTTDHDHDYMVAELLLSPISTALSDIASLSPVIDDTPQSGYLLTYKRQTLGYSWKHNEHNVMRPQSTTRTGHILAVYPDYSERSGAEMWHPQPLLIPISMLNFLEGRFKDESIDSDRDVHIMGRAGHSNPIGGVLGEAAGKGHGIYVEEYSSAIWYRSDSMLFIHYTD